LDSRANPGWRQRIKKTKYMAAKITAKTAVALFISPGVLVDGGGFMIVNGKIIIIPPRGPLTEELIGLLNKFASGKITG
jgi:hypothetical protein